MSDCISDYNLTTHGGLSKQYFYENDQVRMGSTLWQAPELFIENSPVLFADSVKTPLLMMHNKRDQAVLFSQSLEFFLALRRLGKKTWLLQYDEGTHVVSGLSAKDYTIKLEDFFGHYLKQEPAPVWMTGGAEKN
jgi:dipeptidyl aminopeptidase/acylaminoacyl peptidase